MTKTEYLTGRKPKRYKWFLRPLARMRIKDMQKLLKKLSKQGRKMEDKTSDEYKELVIRYTKVEKGIKWWQDLLNEGKEM